MTGYRLEMRTLLAVMLLALLFASGCGAVESGKDLADQGAAFMTAFKDGNFQAAYDLMSPELQQEVGGVADLESMVLDNAATPAEWSFNSVNMSTEDGTNTGTLDGEVTFADGKTGTVNLVFIQDGDTWRLMSFNLEW